MGSDDDVALPPDVPAPLPELHPPSRTTLTAQQVATAFARIVDRGRRERVARNATPQPRHVPTYAI